VSPEVAFRQAKTCKDIEDWTYNLLWLCLGGEAAHYLKQMVESGPSTQQLVDDGLVQPRNISEKS
jgi:hypothetical protein